MPDKGSLFHSLKLETYIAIDLETTGLNSDTDKIIEISAYKFINGIPTEEYTKLVNPKISISKEIVDITGITNEMVETAFSVEDILSEFIRFIDDYPIVGQNIQFDIDFLNVQFDLMGIKMQPRPIYDTLILARAFLYFHHGFSLGAISEYFGFSSEGGHRAGIDTLNTGKIFSELVNECASYPVELIQKLYSTIKHEDIFNKDLFNNIIQAAILNKMINGLTKSRIQKKESNFYFHYQNNKNDDMDGIDVQEWFSDTGLISQKWEGYEPRNSQISFAKDVYEVFQKGELLLAEAGTGLGKSLAYLASGFCNRINSNIPLVVSTYTKNLQNQLFQKDIPQLAKTLGLEMKAVILKGRRNYLCKTRLDWMIRNSKKILSKSDCENILPIIIWSEITLTGDIDECSSFHPSFSSRLWKLICSEPGYCTTQRCDHHNGCFLRKNRNATSKADILVVNHALLINELMRENPSLPEKYCYVIDEGHNLEQAAKDQLICQISERSFEEIFEYFSIDNLIYQKFRTKIKVTETVLDDALMEINTRCSSIQNKLKKFFKHYKRVKSTQFDKRNQKYEQKFIYNDAKEEYFGVDISPFQIYSKLNKLLNELEIFSQNVRDVSTDKNTTYRRELEIRLLSLQSTVIIFDRILKVDREDIVWSSFYRYNNKIYTSLNCAPRDVSTFIANGILSKRVGGVVCSATLTVESSFRYLSESIGVVHLEDEVNIRENIYYSPFHYEDQMGLFVLSSKININSHDYLKTVANQVDVFTSKIHKRMMVLCTSFLQTQTLRSHLLSRFHRSDRKMYVQGRGTNRQSLIRGYLGHKRSVLIGTSSYWEGVDFPGDQLEVLMIIKIPFAIPSDPMVVARTEEYKATGRNAFLDYSVPDAIVRLKQGFGRLIRGLNDHGICIITDPRILNARYGEIVLDSFPLMAKPYTNIETVCDQAKNYS